MGQTEEGGREAGPTWTDPGEREFPRILWCLMESLCHFPSKASRKKKKKTTCSTSSAVTLLFSFGTWGKKKFKTGLRETTVCMRLWAAQAGKVILGLQTQSISSWHPGGPDHSRQRHQPASLPVEASCHTALSFPPQGQGPSSTPAAPDSRAPGPGIPGPEPPWPSR